MIMSSAFRAFILKASGATSRMPPGPCYHLVTMMHCCGKDTCVCGSNKQQAHLLISGCIVLKQKQVISSGSGRWGGGVYTQ